MSRTERTRVRPIYTRHDGGYSVYMTLDRDCRDEGCNHYGCHGWKRPATRKERHDAAALLHQKDEP